AALAVSGVNRGDAEAYASWRAAREGRPYRLPTAEEWECAARGADGRTHPWGNSFDTALCHHRDSLAGEAQVAPVGAWAADCSVHGVRDLAGCMQEWTSSWFD